ncbi:hypothetical protein L2E82_18149 [Cichorium intybus]|uniref:Uncharacterized protein n=1 Tax=Cichorium intybus TaxID=13427 RepID=A0ACB9FA36_CICIN|nr:hypothetical protein L2E82_18149 [Cichorium intybus]
MDILKIGTENMRAEENKDDKSTNDSFSYQSVYTGDTRRGSSNTHQLAGVQCVEVEAGSNAWKCKWKQISWESSSGRSTIYCHSDDWHYWEEKLTPLLMDLYNKDILTSLEVDQIAAHFKNAQTRVGIKLFLNMNLPAARVKYVKRTLANQP